MHFGAECAVHIGGHRPAVGGCRCEFGAQYAVPLDSGSDGLALKHHRVFGEDVQTRRAVAVIGASAP